MAKLTRSQAVGRDSDPTIYYCLGYNGKLDGLLRYHRWALAKFGNFRVMAFAYDPGVLSGGQPKLLRDALDEVLGAIKKDMVGRRVAGVYGMSLGSFFAWEVAALPGIMRGMFNTGGANTAKAVWTSPRLRKERDAFIANGFTQAQVNKVWAPQSIDYDAKRLKGKKLFVMDSTVDKLIPIANVRYYIKEYQKHGMDIELLEMGLTNHGYTIIRNLFRLKRTIKFFSQQ